MPEHHSDVEYLNAIRAGNRTTQEIADNVGVVRQTALERLKRMDERDEVTGEKVAGSWLWAIADE